ncbi:MAG: hypothetical protein SXV54_11465 [Chloroflexota bacterium]|nr:hypothetical protein [Chloroflexota bacterium]
MTGKAGLKAGLIGTAIMLVMTVINQFLPPGGLVYVICGVNMLIYAGIGALAGFFLASPRVPGKGAGAGAIAGLISGGISGVVGFIVTSVRMARGLGYPGLDPQQMQQLAESGIDPTVFAIPGLICGMAIGAGLAAIGGAVFAALKSD